MKPELPLLLLIVCLSFEIPYCITNVARQKFVTLAADPRVLLKEAAVSI
jgi:hypothetical protein